MTSCQYISRRAVDARAPLVINDSDTVNRLSMKMVPVPLHRFNVYSILLRHPRNGGGWDRNMEMPFVKIRYVVNRRRRFVDLIRS